MKYCVYPSLRTKCIKCNQCIKDAQEENPELFYESPWNDDDWLQDQLTGDMVSLKNPNKFIGG